MIKNTLHIKFYFFPFCFINSRGLGCVVWGLVERDDPGLTPASQLVFGLFEGVPLTHMSSMLPIIGM